MTSGKLEVRWRLSMGMHKVQQRMSLVELEVRRGMTVSELGVSRGCLRASSRCGGDCLQVNLRFDGGCLREGSAIVICGKGYCCVCARGSSGGRWRCLSIITCECNTTLPQQHPVLPTLRRPLAEYPHQPILLSAISYDLGRCVLYGYNSYKDFFRKIYSDLALRRNIH